MRVRMLQTRRGSPDGIRAELYLAGQLYDLPAALAKPWLARGIAEEDKLVPSAPETKVEPGPAPAPRIPGRRKARRGEN